MVNAPIWEYRERKVTVATQITGYWERELCTLGEQGWELHTVTPLLDSIGGTSYLLYTFRRLRLAGYPTQLLTSTPISGGQE